MAKFAKGKWRGTSYKVRPLGWRKILPSNFVFPYFVPDKIKFSISITKREGIDALPLAGLSIIEIIPGEKPRPIFSHSNIPAWEEYFEFDDEGYTEEGVVKYVLGDPKGADSHPLIVAKVYSNDDVWLRIFLPTIMGAIGIVLGLVLDKIL